MLILFGPAYQLAIAVIILVHYTRKYQHSNGLFRRSCSQVASAAFHCSSFSKPLIFVRLRKLRPYLSNFLHYLFRFGDICAVQMVSDLTLTTLNTGWCLLKAWSVLTVSNQSRLAMVVGVVSSLSLVISTNKLQKASKTLYFFTCKLHVLMAINRYIFIFHATDSQVITESSVTKNSYSSSEINITLVQSGHSDLFHSRISAVCCGAAARFGNSLCEMSLIVFQTQTCSSFSRVARSSGTLRSPTALKSTNR